MEEIQKPDSHMTSAAAFVKGGIQDACDDACSICLEEFSESDPSTVTNCKHDFHLQCILEWCQRSSQCPMCWQAISLKDPASQELLEVVERERSFRVAPSRNTTIFHHPTLGDFELQHLPVGANDPELEERIIQHLAAAAAMGRVRHSGRRDGQRRSSAHSRPHFLVFSTHPGAQHSGSVSTPLTQIGGETEAAAITVASPATPLSSGGEELSQQMSPFPSGQNTPASGSTVSPLSRRGFSLNNRTSSNSSLPNQERAGPSEFQSFSESLKSRFNAVSLRYKESISKSTRGWKERWFSRNSSMSDLGNEVRREVSAGIASVSRMMERLETRENDSPNEASVSNHLAESSITEQDNQHNAGNHGDNPLSISPTPASHAVANLVSPEMTC
ncbi:E3 ubiquitin-protein ligase RHF2A-like isoform X1 [Herrania umbratica]|uniref:RING-type E3 ubiquitin transferase n=1 Tax=Herrania umbratica TaxID=108875 RepID=A0A6J1AQB1_9ROSI|nr:E3 ubiquitin-protein ligase RHF2A-like isoform X1 [Herrania umbratica]XP_021289396.1 E3 ubiquitin-protein ligase RHF2A-like isoform X1 [Herrania umbratica]XP_021289397.1 E3 ubiquitin-protein ligase RHF2A-like isoform X1 [Herrania umbratica]